MEKQPKNEKITTSEYAEYAQLEQIFLTNDY